MVTWQDVRWGNFRTVIPVGADRNCGTKLAQHLIVGTKIKFGVKEAAQKSLN